MGPVAWFKMAAKHGQLMNSFTEIKLETTQWEAWENYFDRLGYWPYTFVLANSFRSRSWTAPCEWPSQLPEFPMPSARAHASGASGRPAHTPRSQRETLEDLRRKHGVNFGLNQISDHG